MWSPRRRTETVTCIACGTAVDRDDAREYDKYGDRWDRAQKTFEHLCKPCDRTLCRRDRGDLEELLVEVGAGECSRDEFLSQYLSTVRHRQDELEESE